MRCFRVFLAWLVMAAIPLQGMAAASMLYCGMGAHHGTEVVATLDAPAPEPVPALVDGGATAQHDHSQHGHVAAVEVKKIADDGQLTLPDGTHKCGVCASCCNSVAITQFPHTLAFAPVPQAESAEPFVLIHVRPVVVPDRPPRA